MRIAFAADHAGAATSPWAITSGGPRVLPLKVETCSRATCVPEVQIIAILLPSGESVACEQSSVGGVSGLPTDSARVVIQSCATVCPWGLMSYLV